MNQDNEPTSENNSTKPEVEAPAVAVAESATPVANEAAAAERKKAKSRAANRAAVQLLCETYPQTFSIAEPKPLKIGIQEQLIADGKLSQNKIKRGLASYVRAYAYLRSQTDGAARVDLTGAADGAVTADEAAHAAGKLPAPREPRQRNKNARSGEKSNDKRGARRPNKTAKQAQQRQAHAKPARQGQPKVEKADNPFQGLDDGQRMASKLDLLLSKHK
jgi:ProP effector